METLQKQNSSGHKKIEAMVNSISSKLSQNYEDSQLKADNFDFGKLEEMKKQNNKQFFDAMENINNTKTQDEPQEQLT